MESGGMKLGLGAALAALGPAAVLTGAVSAPDAPAWLIAVTMALIWPGLTVTAGLAAAAWISR